MVHAVAMAIGAALLLSWLGSVPGLQGDEAFAGLRAHAIAQGARPLTGMTPYTGPMHQMIAAPLLEILGYSTAVLRLTGALGTLLAAHLHFHAARRVFGARVAALASALLVGSPFFQTFGRYAIETCALHPLLATGAILLLLRKERASALIAGLLLGLGVWTHVIFLPVVVVLAAGAVIGGGRAALVSPLTARAVAGFVLALLPRIAGQLLGRIDGLGDMAGESQLQVLAVKLLDWPMLFLRFVHGDVFFLHRTGEVRLASPPLASIALAAAAVAIAVRCVREPAERCRGGALLAGAAALLVLTLLIAPYNADRYFLLPLWCVPLLIAAGAESSLAKRPAAAALAALAILQAVRVPLNLHLPYRETGGRATPFDLGHMEENSVTFIDTAPLHARLLAEGAEEAPDGARTRVAATPRVYTEFFIGMPLAFHDLAHGRLAVKLLEDLPPGSITLRPADRVVAYRTGGRLAREKHPSLRVHFEDEHFVVLGLDYTPTPP